MKKLFVLFTLLTVHISAAEFLPEKPLFQPLGIDPSESRMSATYGFYDMYQPGGLPFGRVGSLSIGDHMPLINFGSKSEGQWQFGIDGAAKMQFMLDQPSLVLAQADYIFGFDLAWKKDKWSSRARIYHVSSHLGDEYMEATGFNRFQYNTEGIDLLVAYEPIEGVRLFGGGDYYSNIDPEDIGTNMIHFGAEYVHQAPLFANAHFVVLSDFKLYERNDYSPNFAGAIGLEFQKAKDDKHIRLLFEGYTGSSPHTQFYREETNYYGITLQLGF